MFNMSYEKEKREGQRLFITKKWLMIRNIREKSRDKKPLSGTRRFQHKDN